MSLERDHYSGLTLRQADRRWNVIEHDLTILEKRKKEFYAWIARFGLKYEEVVWDDIDAWNNQIRRLSDEQAHLEMYLIENEAPGWTSS